MIDHHPFAGPGVSQDDLKFGQNTRSGGRPYLSEEAIDDAHLPCPGEFCDSHLSLYGECTMCGVTWPYCPTCLYVWDTESQADNCYIKCGRTVLDDIADVLEGDE